MSSSRLELFLRGEHRGPRCDESLEIEEIGRLSAASQVN